MCIRYKKFSQAKDLSLKTEAELKAILGAAKKNSTNTLTNSSSDSSDNDHNDSKSGSAKKKKSKKE